LVLQQYESLEQISVVHELQVDWSAAPAVQIACAQVPLMPLPLPLSEPACDASTISFGASTCTLLPAS